MNLTFVKRFKFFFYLSCLSLIITSCAKEDIDSPTTPQDPEVVNNIIERSNLGAFNGLAGFEDCECDPFMNIDWENGTEEEIIAQIEAILETLSEEELAALFTPVCTEDGEFYPNACYADCMGVTDYDVCEGEDWGCDGDEIEIIDCYEIVFPVNAVYPDGTTVSFNNYDEYIEAIFSGNEIPELVYPFDVVDLEGNVTTVNSADEWAALGVDCFGVGGDGWDPYEKDPCIEYVFPQTLIINGESMTFNSEEELFTYFDEIFSQQEPPEDLIIEQGYPINVVVIETGETIEVNSEDELFDLYVEYCD